MWITYIIITALTYAISTGLKNDSTGSFTGSLIFLAIVAAVVYFAFTMSPKGIMMEEVNKKISSEYKKHKNSAYSPHTWNIQIYCITFLLFTLSRRISAFSKFIAENGFQNNSQHIGIIVLLVGICILLAPLYKYKTLTRSEKREIEYMDEETKKAYSKEIEIYLGEKSKTVSMNHISYMGGHHEVVERYMDVNLTIDEDIMYMYSNYPKVELFNIHVSNISGIQYETVQNSSYPGQSPIYASVDNFMLIVYAAEDKQNHDLRFKIGNKKINQFENRIYEIKNDFSKPEIKENTAYETIESRLLRLKNLRDKNLITEEEYANRKSEILEEI